jgi:hypothetical protein
MRGRCMQVFPRAAIVGGVRYLDPLARKRDDPIQVCE